MILAGDIGGTNTRLAFYEVKRNALYPMVMEIFSSGKYNSLESIIKEFLRAQNLQTKYACFGVAGPVKGGQSKVTNLQWNISEDSLKNEFGFKHVKLINDLEATAHGINELKTEDFFILNKAKADKCGGAALIAAGTGLGEAGLFHDNGRLKPFPSEGGHAGFAPTNEIEIDLLIYLMKEYGHVSYERIVSGPGLYNIYRFLRDTGRGKESVSLKRRLMKGDRAKIISKAAVDGEDRLSMDALELFMSVYGSEAGNLALKLMATGGLYIGGGIAPKIIDKLKGPGFMKAFVNKGRMSSLLKAIPVSVILNDKTALLGAARVAGGLV